MAKACKVQVIFAASRGAYNFIDCFMTFKPWGTRGQLYIQNQMDLLEKVSYRH